MADKIINFESVRDILEDDPDHIERFCKAGIISFTRFRDEYREYVLNRELEKLRKTGHRIRPVAQMLQIEKIIQEYEKAKKLLKNKGSDKQLKKSVQTIKIICDEIIAEFQQKIDNL